MTGLRRLCGLAVPVARGRMRLLVVEDEARLARALQRGLQAEGFVVDLAGDGADRPGGWPATAATTR